MFESVLYELVRNDGDLTAYLSTYEDLPAVFSEYAPEAAKKPYLVFRINSLGPVEFAIETYNIYFDLFDWDKSRAALRAAAYRVEQLIDRSQLQHTNYHTIRMALDSHGPIPDPDERVVHYNLQFSARAARRIEGIEMIGADTMSYKSSVILPGSFSGDPKTATVTFNTAYSDANYSIALDIDATTAAAGTFVLSVTTKTASGFTVSLNSDVTTGLDGVMWQALPHADY